MARAEKNMAVWSVARGKNVCRGRYSLAGTNGIVVSVLFFKHILRVAREVQAGSLDKGRARLRQVEVRTNIIGMPM